MLEKSLSNRQWSDVGLKVLAISIAMTVLLAIADGFIRGFETPPHVPLLYALQVWVSDFRYLFEQGVYAATVFFVGAKFFETRTILTIGFDKLDANKMSLNGPDENNVLWVGRQYGSRFEAETVAALLEERLKASAV